MAARWTVHSSTWISLTQMPSRCLWDRFHAPGQKQNSESSLSLSELCIRSTSFVTARQIPLRAKVGSGQKNTVPTVWFNVPQRLKNVMSGIWHLLLLKYRLTIAFTLLISFIWLLLFKQAKRKTPQRVMLYSSTSWRHRDALLVCACSAAVFVL